MLKYMTLLAFAAMAVAQQPDDGLSRFLSDASEQGWTVVNRASDVAGNPTMPTDVKLVFAVKQRNMDAMRAYLMDVSTPGSPNYGRHLSLEEVGRMTADVEATDALTAWLASHGVVHVTSTTNGEFVTARMPVQLAEKILSAQFYHFVRQAPTQQPPATRRLGRLVPVVTAKAPVRVLRAPSYSLPKELQDRIDFVSGVSDFPPRIAPRFFSEAPVKGSMVDGIPSGYAGPSTIKSYYNVTTASVATTNADQCFFGTLGQSFNAGDLQAFQKMFNLDVQPVSKVIGPNNGGGCVSNPNSCGEASLDVEYMMAIAQGAPTCFWSISGSDQQPYIDFLAALASESNPPYVHSISYGSIEKQLPGSMLDRFDAELVKLGARGLTVMVATGDDGVANFLARSDKSKCGFSPSYPASSPYVTAVGATQGPEDKQAEVAESSSTGGLITTGGGFSTHYTQPAYQQPVVSAYISDQTSAGTLPPLSMFASSGRAYPDVAMLGHNYITVDGGKTGAVSGTSASSPTFAGMVSLINSKRLAAGKSSVGFLNPALYSLHAQNPGLFNDITSGENNCCAGQPGQQVCCPYGFQAAAGWDPLTGLGSPNYGLLEAALFSL